MGSHEETAPNKSFELIPLVTGWVCMSRDKRMTSARIFKRNKATTLKNFIDQVFKESRKKLLFWETLFRNLADVTTLTNVRRICLRRTDKELISGSAMNLHSIHSDSTPLQP